MEALQKNLAQHVDQALEKSLDRIFLDRALACLRRATAATHPHLINDNNASSSRSTPEWLLTSWEIELGPVISMGGFGEVLKGTWLGHHPVAVKRLHMRLETAKLEKEFLREVKTWFPLRHPNILPLLGACASSPRPFMVSPLMTHGHSLQYLDWCERSFGPACVEERGIKLLYEVSLGLQYLHTRSVIHGDLKAVNVLIDEHCNACVADFGFASLKQYATSRMTTTTGGNNNFGGTLRWMSPERLQGGKLAPAVDVYAFAMTSYEVLSEGEVPLTDTPDGLIYQHVVHSNVRPELPEPSASTTYFRTSKALFCLMEQCWSPNPMARPSFSTISLHLKKLHSLAKSKSIDAIDVDQQEIVHAMKSLSSDESTTPATETMVTESMKSSSTTSDSSTSLAFQSAKEVPDSSSHLMAPLTNNIQPARTFSASTTTSGSAASGVTTKTTTKILLAKTGTHEFHLLPNVVIQTIGRGTVHLTIKTPKPHITVYAPTTTVTTAPPSSSVAANTPPITAPTLIYELGTKGITPEGSRIILEQDSNTLYFTVRFPAVGDLFTKLSHSNLVAKLTLVVPQQQQQKQQQLDSPSASTTTNPTQETTTTTTTTTTSPTFESIKIGCEDSLFVNWNAEMLEAGLVAFSNVIHVCAKRSLDVKGVMSGYQELVLDSEYANLDFLLFPGGGGGTGGGGGGARGVGSAVASLATKQIVKVRKGVVKVVVHGFNGLFTTSVKFGSVKLYGSKRWNKETGKRFDCLGSFSVLDQVGREEGLGEFEMLLGKTRVDIEFVE
ncbi:kinase-like domain-containing protein [Obelidium mucronatum]|nr:kinase-like domain-containing protein [Obelidium mucronatum]